MSFPKQNLTRAQKVKEYGSLEDYGRAVLESLNNFRTFSSFKQEEWRIHENYNLLEGRFNREDYMGAYNFFGSILEDFKLPVQLEHYDLMSPKYELIKGEEIKRPFNHKVISVNPDAISKLQKQKNEEIKSRMDYDMKQALVRQGIMEVPKDANGQPIDSVPPRDYDEIEKYYDIEYRDKMEIAAASSLEYLKYQLHLVYKFNEGYGHYLKSAREIYWVGDIEGEPYLRVVDPRFCAYELSSGSYNIEESSWFIEWRYLTASDVYKEFHSELSDEDVDFIEMQKGHARRAHDEPYLMTYFTGDQVSGAENVFRIGNETIVKVTRAEWQGLRKIFFVTYVDEDGQIQERIEDEEWKQSTDRYEVLNVQEEWLDETWEATRIGNDVYVNVRPVPNNDISLDNIGRKTLQYVGTYGRYSFVEKMKQWNLLYDIEMMNLKMDLATAIGSAAVFDVAQIPRSEGFTLDKWLYYLKVFKIGFINSMEEGKRGKPSGFNQFKSMNMDNAATIQHRINVLAFIEGKLGQVAGITPQREGQVSASETVGGVERSVQNSSYITEYLFYHHNETKRRVLERLLDRAKFCWRDGKKAAYVVEGELTRRILDIPPGEFSNENFAIFVTDSSNDHEAMQFLKQAAMQVISSGQADLRHVLSLTRTNNLTQISHTLDELHKQQAEQAQAAEQAKAQSLMQAAQLQGQQQMELEKFKQEQETARTQLTLKAKALMQQMQHNQSTKDANHNGLIDTFEAALKGKELSIQQRAVEGKIENDRATISLEKQKMQLEEQLRTLEIKMKARQNSSKTKK